MRHPSSKIDVDRALKLYGTLKNWREVGKALATEQWRDMPYQGHSIRAAIQRRKKMTDSFGSGIQQLPRVRSHFDVILPRPAPGILAIVDQDDGAVSVTNDIENVVKRLATLGLLREGDRLIYRDSDGQWDEVKWTPEQGFIEFHLLGVYTIEDAVQSIAQ